MNQAKSEFSEAYRRARFYARMRFLFADVSWANQESYIAGAVWAQSFQKRNAV